MALLTELSPHASIVFHWKQQRTEIAAATCSGRNPRRPPARYGGGLLSGPRCRVFQVVYAGGWVRSPGGCFRMLPECGKATRFRQNKSGGQEAEKAAAAPEGERADGEQHHTEAGTEDEGHGPNHSVSPHVEAALMRRGEVGHISASEGHGDHFAQGKENDGEREQG